MPSKPLFPYVLETHLVDHCNLNCMGCSHFSPLVTNDVFRDLDEYRNYLLKFQKIFNDVFEIRLMGGEPLLHPEINQFMRVTRQIFPTTRIAIFTNGLYLEKMPLSFWQTCKKTGTTIKITHYPIALDIKTIKQIAKDFKVQVKIPKIVNTFTRFINIRGDSNPQKSFRECRAMYMCPFLADGKLYTCAFAPHVHIFNQSFNKNFPVSKNDYIDLSQNPTPDQVFEFLKNPIPLCRWCKEKRTSFKWSHSNRDINEWIRPEENGPAHFWIIQQKKAISIYHRLFQLLSIKWRHRK